MPNSIPADPPLFREVQPLRSLWLWLVMLGTYGLTLGVFVWIGYQQLLLGQPVGDNPLPNSGLISLIVIVSILSIVSIVLLYRLKLIVEVYPDRLWIWFYPLSTRLIPNAKRIINLSDIRDYQLRTYRPLRDYGGWGLRRSWRDRAYTVSGTQGVQVTLHSSEAFLIGSQRAQELVDTIAVAIAQHPAA
ncbi:MAG: hypothetical protein F6J87_19085 [Spirulina sp. SIO3F2]|nr:hypothetical protein [Spirulina sp. SIO3F2]